MDFVANSEEQKSEMLDTIGIRSIDELFSAIPKNLVHPAPASDDGLSEAEGIALMEKLASENSFSSLENYVGAGAYSHHIPAIVSAITSRSEFLTAYTPYQAEASQGILQALFEYQTAISRLCAMDLSNASVYDGASACAEGCLMGLRGALKPTLAISSALNPLYRKVVDQYLSGIDCEATTLPVKDGVTDYSILQEAPSVLLYQSPNFFGCIEAPPASLSSLKIACGNPLSYGLFKPPGECGASIAVGDLQPLGLPLSFGGPYAGYIACKTSELRKLPGRIVGKTVDREGKEGFVLTLQAREQHIRREKATSNICTNQSLCALASLAALLWYGPHGLQKLALTNYRRAHYLCNALLKQPGFSPFSKSDYFNEFAIHLPCKAEEALKRFRQEGIAAGYPIGEKTLLIAVTELKNKEQLDRYIEIAGGLK